ncbi:MAG: ABC transporter substrate-binding protein, partial [Coriobacteriia bacterium]|nr:ABC transporter substrate-binding protein [Coriobacteriia bacterium]
RDGDGGEAVVVGSKIDTEGELLGQMIILLLENEDIPTENRLRTGPTEVVRSALLSAEIDMYTEYTGTAVSQFFGDEVDPAISKEATESYETVKGLDEEQNDIVWLQRAPANNTFAIAIPRELSEGEGIETLEDWSEYINEGGEVKLVASQEFADREDGLQAFEETYGFELSDGQLILLSTGDTAQTERAAAQGTEGANAAMAFGTDGNLDALGLVVLEDPRGAQAVFQPAPIVRAEVLETYPRIPDILDPVFEGLTLETLQRLNGQIAVEGRPAAEVAEEYLRDEGLL